MRQDHFSRIKGAICSLENSTFLSISSRGMAVTLDGRCSPYVSHHSVEFEAVEETWGVLFRNKLNRLLVGPGELALCPCGCEKLIGEEIPASFLSALIFVAHKYLGVQGWGIPLLRVSTHGHALSMWDAEGKPIWREHSETEGETVYFGNGFEVKKVAPSRMPLLPFFGEEMSVQQVREIFPPGSENLIQVPIRIRVGCQSFDPGHYLVIRGEG